MWTMVGSVIVCAVVLQVKGDNCPYDGELKAKSTNSVTIFNQSLPAPYLDYFRRQQDRMECVWTIKASDSNKNVGLVFPSFHLIKASTSGKGDCVAIYDADQDDIGSKNLKEEVCFGIPYSTYNSTGRYLTVVFRQGVHAGRRWFTMKYAMVSSDVSEANRFWSSTLGRILSFLIIIAIFSIFSFVFKAWRKGSVSDTCGSCWECMGRRVSRVLQLGSRCTSLFKSRARAEDRSSRQGAPEGQRISRSDFRASEADDADTDIMTISGFSSTPAPDLSNLFPSHGSDHSSSSGRHMGDPPPDYSTVLAGSIPSSTSSERSDIARHEGDALPDYNCAVEVPWPLPVNSQDLSPSAAVSPPPDDGSAPPSYEPSAPPSYDSLFDTTNA